MARRGYIPIGDHCCAAILGRESGWRHKSYPFDWCVHVDEANSSNLTINTDLIDLLLKSGSAELMLSHFLPSPPNEEQVGNEAQRNHVRFPHDKFWESRDQHEKETAKYLRRTNRLLRDILLGENDFIVVTRSFALAEDQLARLEDLLLSFHSGSRLIYITGTRLPKRTTISKHPLQSFAHSIPWREGIPSYVDYTEAQYYQHDIAYWRQNVKECLAKYF